MASHLTGGEVGFTGFFRLIEQVPGFWEPGRGVANRDAVPRHAAGVTDAAPCVARGRTETPPQHSQRVLLAKPRTAAASRHGSGGPVAKYRALPQRNTSVGHEAKPRTAPMARRRDGDIAPPG